MNSTSELRLWGLHATSVFPGELRQVLDVPGTLPPPGFDAQQETVAALFDFRTNGPDMARRALEEATLSGDVDAARKALADLTIAQAAGADADGWNRLQTLVTKAQRTAYADVAHQNFDAVAEWYADAAERLQEAVSLVDPAESAERILHASAKVRTSWETAGPLGEEAAQRLTVLALAAKMAGKKPVSPLDMLERGDDDGGRRRAVWSAWEDTTRRGGRISALILEGVDVAPRQLEDVVEYRRPLDYVAKRVQSSGIGWTQRLWDPETEDWKD